MISSKIPFDSIYAFGARNVILATPGCHPTSIKPVIIARYITSGTLMPNRVAARSIPLSVASFRLAPVPINETG